MNEQQGPPAFSAADMPIQDEGWHLSTRYEVLERWLESAKVRQVRVRDIVTGHTISRTDFYEGP
jgi:hypothetical protein